MRQFLKQVARAAIVLPVVIGLSAATAQADKIRIALAETPSDDLAAFFVALR